MGLARWCSSRAMNRAPKLGEDKPLYLSPRQDSPTMLTGASASEARPMGLFANA